MGRSVWKVNTNITKHLLCVFRQWMEVIRYRLTKVIQVDLPKGARGLVHIARVYRTLEIKGIHLKYKRIREACFSQKILLASLCEAFLKETKIYLLVSYPGCPPEHIKDNTQHYDHNDYQHQEHISCREKREVLHFSQPNDLQHIIQSFWNIILDKKKLKDRYSCIYTIYVSTFTCS